MARSGFLPTSRIERFLAFAPPEARDIALELRNIVAGVCPYATESVLWGALSYHDGRKGGRVKGAICAITVHKLDVKLSFIHGARLEDPERLLRGDQLSKRHLQIDSFDTAPWEAIRGLVEAAAALDPTTFGALEPSRAKGP
jgi:hypothetical protein